MKIWWTGVTETANQRQSIDLYVAIQMHLTILCFYFLDILLLFTKSMWVFKDNYFSISDALIHPLVTCKIS